MKAIKSLSDRNTVIIAVIKLLSKFYFSDVQEDLRKSAIREVELILTTLFRTRGISTTTKYLKNTRLCVTKYLCKEPLVITERVSLDKDGFPKRFPTLKVLIDSGHPSALRFTMTLLQVSRALRPPVTGVDYTTIENPEIDDIATIPSSFMNKFISDFGLEGYRHSIEYKSFF
jgi:hypothetical protein